MPKQAYTRTKPHLNIGLPVEVPDLGIDVRARW